MGIDLAAVAAPAPAPQGPPPKRSRSPRAPAAVGAPAASPPSFAAAAASAHAIGPWALQAAALFAVAPLALGGVRLRGSVGPARDAWIAAVRAALPPSMPWHRLPLSIEEDRLLGGLDLAASLAARRSVMQRGLLAQCHGGVLVAPMAERLPARTAAALAAVLDRRELVVEREGFAERQPAHLAVIALDEALPEDEPLAAALADRLAFDVTLGAADGAGDAADGSANGSAAIGAGLVGVEEAARDEVRASAELGFAWPDVAALEQARRRLPSTTVPDALLEALCQATLALGIHSARAPWWALQVARASAALAGRATATEADARLAARLVLAPRATRMPAAAPPDDEAPDAPPPAAQPEAADRPPVQEAADEHEASPPPPPDPEDTRPLDERLVAAALAALPRGLLAQLALSSARAAGARASRNDSEGRAGAIALSRRRGAPLGARPGDPRRGERLSLVETLRAAIPWQRLRAQDTPPTVDMPLQRTPPRGTDVSVEPTAGAAARPLGGPRLRLRMDDLRVVRRAQHRRSTTVFLIDASGSAALHRLAEAKGAVEQLLAESYVRRDEVAVIAFRGQRAEVLLPPTRSLVRAKRALAGLPGGGGTPLAAALDAADALVDQVQRRGATASVVLLTDGRANVARDPAAGRAQAEADAHGAARRLAVRGARTLLIDTSPRPAEAAVRLAAALQARYLPLPHVRADLLSAAVRQLGA